MARYEQQNKKTVTRIKYFPHIQRNLQLEMFSSL